MTTERINYKPTLRACYLGYITQAVVNCLLPLLFTIIQAQYGVSLERLGRLIFINFFTQLLVDLASVKLVEWFSCRALLVACHAMAVLGLWLLPLLPGVLPDPYVGLCIAVILSGIGGGMLEVLVSPVVESVPGDDKAGTMSLLHSFYCWGQMGVVLLTTIFLQVFGRGAWFVLPLVWSAIPLFNLFRFIKVPLRPIAAEEGGSPLRVLFRQGFFWVILVVMVCAGAGEGVMSMWSSLFAEKGLGVSKVMGDLLGPCMFALFMGLGRLGFSKKGSRIRLENALVASAALCIVCYITAVIAPWAVLSLAACGICGLSVSLMWPGSYSLAAREFPAGGAQMFAVMALAGDMGCSVGPWISGLISDFVAGVNAGNPIADQIGLKWGIVFGAVFPIVMLVAMLFHRRKKAA